MIDHERVKRYLLDEIAYKQSLGVDADKNLDKLRKISAKKLGADYLVYGSFQKIGNKIQLNAKFVKVDSGNIVTSARVYGNFPEQIFDLQESLAKKLIKSVSGGSTEQSNNLTAYTKSTDNYSAYSYYIKGQYEKQKYTLANYKIAIDYFDKAIVKDPNYALAWAGAAETYAAWGFQVKYVGGESKSKLEKAEQYGKKSVLLGPNIYQSYVALTFAYLNTRKFNEAEKIALKGLKINPNSAELNYLMGAIKNYGGTKMAIKGSEANIYIMKALQLNPDYIIARWSLARSYEANKLLDLSLAEYKKILQINPKHVASLHNIALIYYDKQDYKNVIRYVERAISAEYKNPKQHYTLGLAHYSLKEYDKAEKAFQVALSFDKEYFEAMYMLGSTFNYKKKYQEAIKWLKKASLIEVSSKNFHMLGVAHYNLAKYQEAITWLTKAIAEKPDDKAFYMLGSSYYMLKNYTKAKESYQEALKKNPNHENAKIWLKKIENLNKPK